MRICASCTMQRSPSDSWSRSIWFSSTRSKASPWTPDQSATCCLICAMVADTSILTTNDDHRNDLTQKHTAFLWRVGLSSSTRDPFGCFSTATHPSRRLFSETLGQATGKNVPILSTVEMVRTQKLRLIGQILYVLEAILHLNLNLLSSTWEVFQQSSSDVANCVCHVHTDHCNGQVHERNLPVTERKPTRFTDTVSGPETQGWGTSSSSSHSVPATPGTISENQGSSKSGSGVVALRASSIAASNSRGV